MRQRRGACIGAPASPLLCEAVVAMRESEWISRDPSRHLNGKVWSAVRCVDSLLVMGIRDNRGKVSYPPELADPLFYGDPIVLEVQPDLCLLGVEVCVIGNQVRSQVNAPASKHLIQSGGESLGPESWRYHSNKSAAHLNSAMVSLVARLWLCKTIAIHPDDFVDAVMRLLWTYSHALAYNIENPLKSFIIFMNKNRTPLSNFQTRDILQLLNKQKSWKAMVSTYCVTHPEK